MNEKLKLIYRKMRHRTVVSLRTNKSCVHIPKKSPCCSYCYLCYISQFMLYGATWEQHSGKLSSDTTLKLLSLEWNMHKTPAEVPLCKTPNPYQFQWCWPCSWPLYGRGQAKRETSPWGSIQYYQGLIRDDLSDLTLCYLVSGFCKILCIFTKRFD